MDARDFDCVDFVSLLEPKLVENLDAFKKGSLDNDEPVGIIIDGAPGKSKTTNACVIARSIQPNFDESKQLGQGTDNFIKAYNYTIDVVRSKYKVVIYDEANESSASNALNRIQKILNQVLVATSREEKVIIIVVLHRFYSLNKNFIGNSLVHMLIHLYDKSNNNYVRFKAYDMDCMLWMKHMISSKKVVKEPKVYSSSYPNFGGCIHAPSEEYIKFIKSMSKVGKDLLRQKGTRDILSAQYYTVSVVASMLGVTKSQVNYKINELGLQNDYLREKSGRIFYYDKELFAILRKHYKKLDDDRVRREDNGN